MGTMEYKDNARLLEKANRNACGLKGLRRNRHALRWKEENERCSGYRLSIRSMLWTLAAGLLIGMLAGCTGKFRSPEMKLPDRYLYAGNLDTSRTVVNTRWWENFGDTLLNSLIEQALENNRDLAAAASRVEQARINIGAVRSQFLPSFGAGLSGSAEYTEQTKIEQEYFLKPSVSWEISLFGKLKHATEAARAELLSSEAAYRGVMLSLAAEVATTYFTLLQYERNLEISIKSYRLRKQSTDMIDSMFRYGMSSAVALEQARGLTATAAADIPQYQRAVAQTALSLNILLGENPQPFIHHSLLFYDTAQIADGQQAENLNERRTPIKTEFDQAMDAYIRSGWESDGKEQDELGSTLLSDSLPEKIPAGLPAALLQRRPDILEAYYKAQAAWARIGVAQAARWPSISLTADGGVLSGTVKGLFHGNPFVWSAGLSVTEPIFAFGRNKRNVEIAREESHQAVLDYEQTVLTALGDVEKALVAISTYREQLQKQRELLRATAVTQLLTNELYRSGLTDYLQVLDAERTFYDNQIQYISIRSQQFVSYIALYKALGGGW